MSLPTYFSSNPSIYFPKPSKTRIIIACLLGFAYAFAFYAFLYMSREMFRLFSVTESYDVWELSEQAFAFYNFFFAFIAIIMGQAVAITFCLQGPRKIFGTMSYHKTRIIHDQQVLNWYFLSWFAKLAIVFWAIFGAIPAGWYAFSFYPNYTYIFILIMVVLYLYTWLSIQRIIPKYNLLYFSISSMLVVLFSFGLSNIHIVDAQGLQDSLLHKNIFHQYDLELVETNNCQKLYKYYHPVDIYLVQPNTSSTSSSVIVSYDTSEVGISLTELRQRISSALYHSSSLQWIAKLYIDKDIKMKYINQVKWTIAQGGFVKIAYVAVPANPSFNQQYYKNCFYQTFSPPDSLSLHFYLKAARKAQNHPNALNVNQDSLGNYYCNQSLVEVPQLKQKIRQYIQENEDYLVRFYVRDDVSFSTYFTVLDIVRQVVFEFREAYAQNIYCKDYSALTYQEQKQVRQKYPLNLFEFPENLQALLTKEY